MASLSNSPFVRAVLLSRLIDRETLQQRLRQFVNDSRHTDRAVCPLSRRVPGPDALSDGPAAGRAERGFFLGGCKILERIGASAMGRVYRAEQLKLGRQVALKMLAPQYAHDPSVT